MPELTAQAAFDEGQKLFDQKSYDAAVIYYQQAVEKGHAEAINGLGCCYEDGLGVEKDLEKAFDHYSRAASLKNPFGCFNIAMCYQEGIHVKQSDFMALHWLELAAQYGDDEAPYMVAVLYYFGRGSERNLQTTREWLNKAWPFVNKDTQNKLLARLDVKTWTELQFTEHHFEVMYLLYILKNDSDNMYRLLERDPRAWFGMFEQEKHRLRKSPDDRNFMRELVHSEDMAALLKSQPELDGILRSVHHQLACCYLAAFRETNDEAFMDKAQEHLSACAPKATPVTSLVRLSQTTAVQTGEPESDLTSDDKRKFHFFG